MTPDELKARIRAWCIALRGVQVVDDVVIRWQTKSRDSAWIETADRKHPERRTKLKFTNGAELNFFVLLQQQGNDWSFVTWSFHFEREGLWFRYELDSERAHGLVHPLRHLHVGNDEPRYPTGEIELLDLFDFLVAQGFVS